jgi:precorrin-2 dehydrogenase/sirohydrochlorin ferrochelatase
MPMPLYPLFADLDQRDVLVVGGGDVATRKVEALLRAGARVRVCARRVSAQLADWIATGRVQHLADAFEPDWLDDVWLVVAATDDGVLNARLAGEAAARKRLVNVVDDAALSTFQVPVVVDRDPLLVAISSSGAAPMLARRLGRQLESQLDDAWGDLAALFARHREAIRQRFPDLAERRHWYDAQIDGEVMARLRHADTGGAERALLTALQSRDAPPPRGTITLITLPGGNAPQLTLHALRAMHRADHVLFHDSMGDAVVMLARRDAVRSVAATLDGDVPGSLGAQAAAGRRVVVLWPDTSPLSVLDDATADAMLELIECGGQARRLR